MTRASVPEIAAAVVALMDDPREEVDGDHAFNRVTYDRPDWPRLEQPVATEVERLTNGERSIYRAPCGCTWPTSRLDTHGDEAEVDLRHGPLVTLAACLGSVGTPNPTTDPNDALRASERPLPGRSA